LAENVVIGVLLSPARRGLPPRLRFRLGLRPALAAAHHLLEDLAEPVVAVRALRTLGLPPLRRLLLCRPASEHVLQDLAEGVVERVGGLRRLLPALRLVSAHHIAPLAHHLLDDLAERIAGAKSAGLQLV